MNSPKNWDLQVDPDVYKTLERTPRHAAEAILKIIGFFAINPYFGDIKKMRGESDTWRRRIGAYRVFYKMLSKDLKTGLRIWLSVISMDPLYPSKTQQAIRKVRGCDC